MVCVKPNAQHGAEQGLCALQYIAYNCAYDMLSRAGIYKGAGECFIICMSLITLLCSHGALR